MRDWTPRPYQPLMMAHVIRNPRCALFVPMGAGKTTAILAVLDAWFLSGLAKKAIVFAPLRVARDTWPQEALKWNQFVGMRIKFIEWTLPERAFLQARAKFLKLKAADEKIKDEATKQARDLALMLRHSAIAARLAVLEHVDVQCVNYDVIQQLVAILGEEHWPFDTVIADESTRLKNLRTKQGGKRTQALMKVAFSKITRWVNLTGTPSPNGLADLYGQLWFIDQGKRLGTSFTSFQNRWFGFKRASDAIGYKPGVERVVFPHAQAEIQTLIKDVCLSLDMKGWFDLNEPIVKTLYVDLPPTARRHYNEMARKMFTEIAGLGVEAFAAAGKTIKCLQIANGFAYTGDDEVKWVDVHDEKLDVLESIVEEAAGMPVLVAYHFKPDLIRLKKRFPQGLDLSTKDGMAAAKRGGGRVWFGHPQSMGHGVDGLQYHSNILVYFAHWWDLEPRLQVLERIGPMRQMQAGFERPVFVYNIVARGTMDESVIERTVTKRSVQDILLGAMKRNEEKHAV